jgi:hypothetical protein
MTDILPMPIKDRDWSVGDLVRVREGRGTVYEISPLKGFARVKLLLTGRKVTVRLAELQSGALS